MLKPCVLKVRTLLFPVQVFFASSALLKTSFRTLSRLRLALNGHKNPLVKRVKCATCIMLPRQSSLPLFSKRFRWLVSEIIKERLKTFQTQKT